ncbi:MAG: STAS domain-containing protein [Bacteroidaceae bacterium]|nr:STAS domain-containing protein [Bacteroidaceae bacterium]
MAQATNQTCNITLDNSSRELTISFAGHLDTATSAKASTQINSQLDALEPEHVIESLTCDASQLEYISSSGLRILLSLAKRYKKFRVINVQPQVYEVLETTGFTKIMTVERAMRRLSVEGCRLIGIGSVGKVFRLDGDTIIKVFREGTTMEEVRREITLSKEAFVLGMPTAISFDVVRVAPTSEGGAECYGLVYELLKAKTLSTYLKQHPDRLDECARQYAGLFMQLHEIEVPESGSVPSAILHERQHIEHIRCYFPEESISMMLSIIDSIPECNRLLHLDLQTKNAMVQDGELMLIDMGEVSYGHPLLDLGHAYASMVGLIGDYEKIIGMPRDLGRRFWERAIDYYFAGLPADVVEERKAQIEVVSYVRNFSWLALSDSFPEAIIEECKANFTERIAKRYDHIMSVCKTFRHWTL